MSTAVDFSVENQGNLERMMSQKVVKRESTDPQMSLIEAIQKRRSVRGYLDREVSPAVLERIFEIAQRSPSNCNVQPWKVYVASGALKQTLSEKMVDLTREGVTPNPDFPFRGDFENDYRRRQVECAVALYSEMGIERHDLEGRQRAVLRNFEFFDAPHMAFVGMDPAFGTTVAIDVGMWAQTLMLTLVAFGLASCPMATMRNYPDLVRDAFGIQDGTRILFGIAFGYEDPGVPANRTVTSRDPIGTNVVFKS